LRKLKLFFPLGTIDEVSRGRLKEI